MTVNPGLGVTGNGVGVTTPLAHKLAQSGLIAKTGAGTNAIRPGLFFDGVTTIVSGTANMSYNVAAFTAALSRGGSAGTVLLANDGTVNVATTAAPASNSRIDVVYVWQREFSLDGTNSNPVIGVAQGTAAASPVAPSLAAFPGALELARITVPAGVTATNTGTTITQVAPFTAAAGGVIPFRSTTERASATVAEGQLSWLIDSDTLAQYSGSAWVVTAEDTGWVDMTSTVDYTETVALQCRRVNRRVELRGILTKAGAGTLIATLPVGFRPPASYVFPVANSGNVSGRFTIDSGGGITLNVTLTNGTLIYMHGVQFLTD